MIGQPPRPGDRHQLGQIGDLDAAPSHADRALGVQVAQAARDDLSRTAQGFGQLTMGHGGDQAAIDGRFGRVEEVRGQTFAKRAKAVHRARAVDILKTSGELAGQGVVEGRTRLAQLLPLLAVELHERGIRQRLCLERDSPGRRVGRA